MKISHNIFPAVLLALAGAGILGLILTARPPRVARRSVGPNATALFDDEIVDQRPLETARSLGALASSAEERQFSQDAVRVADHEVDLAFASALRTASQQPSSNLKQDQATRNRINKAQSQTVELKTKIKQLTARSAKTKGTSRDNLPQQITLAQAQLELAQDELADAQEDLTRAGGGDYARIQRMWQEHESAQHANGATIITGGGIETAAAAQSLIARWRTWSNLGAKQATLAQAQRYLLPKINVLTLRHDALEQHVQTEQNHKLEPAHQLANAHKAGHGMSIESSGQSAAAAISTLRQLSQDEVNLADLDRRIQDLRDLSMIYGQWTARVDLRQRAALHRLIRPAVLIVLILLAVILAGRLVNRLFDRIQLERKQQMTLRSVVWFTVQALGALVILLILFGSPNHMSTVLGLAGAGLTVALKDFVISFFGWFVLMGRNGIRVGDWVEINGVRGEVSEIGLLRTMLLETGNWTEAGHPTGRQVAFLNSYAVEGYYFNFSTSGQWMWDELPVLIPSQEDPYAAIEKLRDIVIKETAEDARRAEEEWQHAARRSGVRSISAAPEINVRPTDSGVQLVIRYITRAGELYQVRARLSHAIVRLLHHASVVLPPAAAALESGAAIPQDNREQMAPSNAPPGSRT